MKILENKTEFDEIINADKPVLVDFFATWCMPCKMMSSVLEDLSVKYNDKLNVVKLDIDKLGDIAKQYDIYSVPTMILYKDGNVLDTIIGFRNIEELSVFVDKYTN